MSDLPTGTICMVLLEARLEDWDDPYFSPPNETQHRGARGSCSIDAVGAGGGSIGPGTIMFDWQGNRPADLERHLLIKTAYQVPAGLTALRAQFFNMIITNIYGLGVHLSPTHAQQRMFVFLDYLTMEVVPLG